MPLTIDSCGNSECRFKCRPHATAGSSSRRMPPLRLYGLRLLFGLSVLQVMAGTATAVSPPAADMPQYYVRETPASLYVEFPEQKQRDTKIGVLLKKNGSQTWHVETVPRTQDNMIEVGALDDGVYEVAFTDINELLMAEHKTQALLIVDSQSPSVTMSTVSVSDGEVEVRAQVDEKHLRNSALLVRASSESGVLAKELRPRLQRTGRADRWAVQFKLPLTANIAKLEAFATDNAGNTSKASLKLTPMDFDSWTWSRIVNSSTSPPQFPTPNDETGGNTTTQFEKPRHLAPPARLSPTPNVQQAALAKSGNRTPIQPSIVTALPRAKDPSNTRQVSYQEAQSTSQQLQQPAPFAVPLASGTDEQADGDAKPLEPVATSPLTLDASHFSEDPPALVPPALDPPALVPPTLNPPTLNPPELNPPTLNPPTLNPPELVAPALGLPLPAEAAWVNENKIVNDLALSPTTQAHPIAPQIPYSREEASSRLLDAQEQATATRVILQRARNAVLEHKLEEALQLFSDCEEMQPNFTGPLADHADLLMKLGRWKEAADIWRRLIRLEPSNNGAKFALAFVYDRLGNKPESRRLIQSLADNDLLNMDQQRQYIEWLTEDGDILRARQYYSGHMADQPIRTHRDQVATIHSLIALGHRQQGQHLLESLLVARTPLPVIAGVLLRLEEKYGVSFDLGPTVPELDVYDAQTLDDAFSTVGLLLKHGRLAEAEQVLLVIAEYAPLDRRLTHSLATLLLEKGELAAAEKHLDLLGEDNEQGRDLRVKWHSMRGELALAIATSSFDLMSGTGGDPVILGSAYERLTATDIAEKIYLQAAYGPNVDVAVSLALAEMYNRQKQFAAAIGICEDILKEYPTHFRALYLFTVAMSETHEGALAAIEKIKEAKSAAEQLPIGPFLSDNYETLIGYAYWRVGMLEVAQSQFLIAKRERGNFDSWPAELLYASYASTTKMKGNGGVEELIEYCVSRPKLGAEVIQSALSNRDYTAAKMLAVRLLERFPDNILVLQAYGLLLAEIAPDAAMSTYNSLLKSLPASVSAKLALARLHWKKQNSTEAARLYNDVIRSAPKCRAAMTERARLTAQFEGSYAGARAYTEALESVQHTLPKDLRLLEDKFLIKNYGTTGSLATQKFVALKLESSANFLSNWRPDNSASFYDALQCVRPDDEYVAMMGARQNIELSRWSQAELAISKLLKTDSSNLNAREALAYIRRQKQQKINGDFLHWSQTGRGGLNDMTINRFGLKYDIPLQKDNQLSAGYAGMLLATDESDFTAHALRLEGLFHATPNAWVNAELQLAEYGANVGPRPEFALQMRHRAMDGLIWGLNGNLENLLENQGTVDQDIYAVGVGPWIQWVASNRWEMEFDYSFQSYSDNNFENSFGVASRYSISPAPRRLTGVVEYRFRDFAKQTIGDPRLSPISSLTHPYFAPSSFGVVSLGIDWSHDLTQTPFYKDGFSYWCTYSAQFDTLNVFYHVFGGGCLWKLTKGLEFTAGTQHVMSSEYVSAAVTTNIIWTY